VVVLAVVVVVVLVVVVVVVGPHGGVTEPSQEQSGFVLQLPTTDFLHARNSASIKAPHAELISSEHCLLPQIGGAALARETKTPATSATVANMTTAPLATLVLVIVEPPSGRSCVRIRFCFCARPLRAMSSTTSSTRLSRIFFD
jgi:hypothetical protein